MAFDNVGDQNLAGMVNLGLCNQAPVGVLCEANGGIQSGPTSQEQSNWQPSQQLEQHPLNTSNNSSSPSPQQVPPMVLRPRSLQYLHSQSLHMPLSPHSIQARPPLPRRNRYEMRPLAAHTRTRRFPEKYLPVPKNTFKNPNSQKAQRRRELDEKIYGDELTARVRRLAKERGQSARALRMHIAEKKKARARLMGLESEKENTKNEDSTPRSLDEYCGWRATCTMPIVVRAAHPTPRIVLTTPDGAVQGI